MMHPTEAYAFPVSDKRGTHVATVIHVGPKASRQKVQRLVKSLIKDPTGYDASHRLID
jgi:hypothetical protein